MRDKKILIIDDDINLCQLVKFAFSREGAEVFTAHDGRSGLQQFYKSQPDLIILDIRMPDIDGWETCRQIRNLSDVPVVMLTMLHRDDEIVKGLSYGADDFVTKPFSHEVLIARSKAVLRRTEQLNEKENQVAYSDDYLAIDLERRRVMVRGKAVQLTATEFRLLSLLLRNAGRVLTYEAILRQVWGDDYEGSTDYVQVYLSHLRRKIEEEPRKPRYLLTEHGVGYRFERMPIGS